MQWLWLSSTVECKEIYRWSTSSFQESTARSNAALFGSDWLIVVCCVKTLRRCDSLSTWLWPDATRLKVQVAAPFHVGKHLGIPPKRNFGAWMPLVCCMHQNDGFWKPEFIGTGIIPCRSMHSASGARHVGCTVDVPSIHTKMCYSWTWWNPPFVEKKSNCVKEISNLSESTCFHTASTTRCCRLAGVLRCPSPRREPAWSNTWKAILRLSSQSCLGFLWISNFWRSWSWSCLIHIPEYNGCISGKVTLFRCSGACHWNHTWLV